MLETRSASLAYYSPAHLLLHGGGRFLGLLAFCWLLTLVQKKYRTRWGAPLLQDRCAKLLRAALYVLLACEGFFLVCYGTVFLIRDYKYMDILDLDGALLRLAAWLTAGGITAFAFMDRKNN